MSTAVLTSEPRTPRPAAFSPTLAHIAHYLNAAQKGIRLACDTLVIASEMLALAALMLAEADGVDDVSHAGANGTAVADRLQDADPSLYADPELPALWR